MKVGINHLGSIEFWKFVERLRNYELYKKECPSWIYTQLFRTGMYGQTSPLKNEIVNLDIKVQT